MLLLLGSYLVAAIFFCVIIVMLAIIFGNETFFAKFMSFLFMAMSGACFYGYAVSIPRSIPIKDRVTTFDKSLYVQTLESKGHVTALVSHKIPSAYGEDFQTLNSIMEVDTPLARAVHMNPGNVRIKVVYGKNIYGGTTRQKVTLVVLTDNELKEVVDIVLEK